MSHQNYRNHKRFVFLYHGFTFLCIIALLIGSLVNLAHTSGETLYSASLLVLVALILLSLFVYTRLFPLRVQDRAIRAEENLRHFILSGKPLDGQLTMQQIIALRFASDEELVELAKRAVDEALNNDEIKQAIRNWRADHCRA
jgi:energy-coupling factor transporter transmembrane protein EcfT